MFMMYTTKKV